MLACGVFGGGAVGEYEGYGALSRETVNYLVALVFPFALDSAVYGFEVALEVADLLDECGGEKSVLCRLIEAYVDSVFAFLKELGYVCLHFLLLKGDEVAVYVEIKEIVADEMRGGLFYLVKGEIFS